MNWGGLVTTGGSRVTVQEHFSSLHDITGTLIGTVGDLPAVAEGGAYTELAIGDSPETASLPNTAVTSR
jgi:hypothetical protein